MDTTQLECFVQVAEGLNFHRAAKELHLSQSTVSKQVASLEAELKGALFVRSTRSVALTPFGEEFLLDAQEILRIAYSASNSAHQRLMADNFTIAYSDPNELGVLSDAIRALRQENKKMRVSLVQCARDEGVGLLERGQVDAVLAYEGAGGAAPGVRFEKVVDDRLACLVRKRTALSRWESATSEALKGTPQIVCLPSGIQRRGYHAEDAVPHDDGATAMRCRTVGEAVCLVRAGFGYSLIPSAYAHDLPSDVARVPWSESPAAPYGVYMRSERDNQLAQELARRLRGILVPVG